MTESEKDEPTMMLQAAQRPHRQGLGITWKIFLSTAGIVALAMATAIVWNSRRADQLLDQGVRRSFDSTRTLFDNIQATRYDKLSRLNAFVAGDSTLFAVITDADEATLKDDLLRRQDLLGSDFLLVADAEGKLMARTDDLGKAGDDLSAWPLVKAALDGQRPAGLLSQGNHLFNAVAVPIGFAGEQLLGVLVSGYAISDSVAEEMKRTTGTEVAFLAVVDGRPQLAASTLKQQAEVAGVLALALEPGADRTAEPRRVAIANLDYLGSVTPLVTASGEQVGGLVILRSIAAELATFQQLRSSLVYTGLVAIVAAFLVSFLIAKRITGPLLGLVRVAQSVTQGRYDIEVPATGSDEVGSLARAVRGMVRELREKAELEKYVAELGAGPAQTATLSSASTLASAPTVVTAGAPAEPIPGALFAGRYEIAEVIGKGGMGKVYKARDRDLDEVIALKTIRKDVLGSDPAALERFKQEIKLARKATHKNIMRTYDFGDAAGVHYLTMEYVAGYTLRDLVRRQKELPLGIALRIAKQVCTGLYAAHDAGIIHRDVKSLNILIQPNGELKVMDFGIARPRESSGLTTAGAIVGTPEYMSPEQALGKEADHRSDIYAAGIVFYELFTGRLPFTGDSAIAVVMKHVQEAIRPPREIRASVLPEVEAIVLRMVDKDPARRFQSFAEVHAALSRIQVPAAPAKAA